MSHRHYKKVNFDMMALRYHRSSRINKTKLLNELTDLYGYNRKYLLQVFNFHTGKKYIKKGRKPKYDSEELILALRNIWIATSQMCSKKLKVAIPMWLPFYPAALRHQIT